MNYFERVHQRDDNAEFARNIQELQLQLAICFRVAQFPLGIDLAGQDRFRSDLQNDFGTSPMARVTQFWRARA